MATATSGITSRRPAQARGWQAPAATALVLGLASLLAACGSSPSASVPSKPAQPSAAAISAACQQIAAALSDGPDPSADPVGYAEAQILPLRQIKTADLALHKAIDELASAYQTEFKTNAAKGSTTAVSKADRAVDAICPGATS
jgi:hypothetical protein